MFYDIMYILLGTALGMTARRVWDYYHLPLLVGEEVKTLNKLKTYYAVMYEGEDIIFHPQEGLGGVNATEVEYGHIIKFIDYGLINVRQHNQTYDVYQLDPSVKYRS